MALRIIVADDHDIIRRGLKQLLTAHSGWEVCAEAKTGREAVTIAEQLRPDIVVMDISMPDLNGLEATRQIRKACPRTEVLVITHHDSDEMAAEVMDAGARGYVLKSDSDTDLVRALEALSRHKPFFTNRVTEMFLANRGSRVTNPADAMRNRLTPREREILQLLAEGMSMKEVAGVLDLKPGTVAFHKYRMMENLGIRTNAALLEYAIKRRMTS